MKSPTYLYSGIRNNRKYFFTFMLLIFMLVFTGCSDSDDDDNYQVNIATDSLSVTRDSVAETYTYGQGKASFTEVSATGTVEDCFCQRLAFRSAQALQASQSFRTYYPAGISVNDIQIVTKWSTDGAEELFVDNLGWSSDNVRIYLNAADPDYLTLADAVFYFVSADGKNAWKVSAGAALFPEGFFTARTAAKTVGSAADKTKFKALKKDAMDNYLGKLPIENLFTVEKISLSTDNLAASLTVFAGWEGKWRSWYSYLDNSGMTLAYEAVAAAAPGYTPEDVKSFMSAMYRTDFSSMEIREDNISYIGADSNILASCRYKSAGTETASWNSYQLEWHKFESVAECSGYRHLVLLAVHSDGEGGLIHWHMRYGDNEFAELIDYPDAMWWPTLLADTTTAQQIAADSLSEAAMFAAMLPQREVTGILVIAHGSDEAQWNDDVISAVQKVNLPYPVALGFLEYHEQDIAFAISTLEKQGVNRIIAVPLFISTYSNHIEEIRYVLGLRDTLPETDAASAHPGSESAEEAELVPIQSSSKIVLTSAIDDHPAVAAILMEHLATISQAPEKEIAVLAGHGWDAPEYKEKWDQMFTSLASQVKTALGLKDVRHAFVAMGDPPLADTVSAAMTEGDVLIVPVMLSEGYFTKTLIPRLLQGLTYRYTEKSLLPKLSAAAIIEDRVNHLISSEK